MEMAGNGVFKEVNKKITHQHQQGSLWSADGNAFRQHFQKRRAQHEPGAQGDKVTEVAAFPVFLHNHRAAQTIGQGGSQAQQDACSNRVHWKN